MQSNSKFYSAILPQRITGALPHITIQCPVYKEGLTSVIAPTVRSLKQAMSTYEMQGGSANIFMNDDGMQIIDDKLASSSTTIMESGGLPAQNTAKTDSCARESSKKPAI
jgi:hypothetical protein